MKAFATSGAVLDDSGVTRVSFEKRSVMTRIFVEPFSFGGKGPRSSISMYFSGSVAGKSSSSFEFYTSCHVLLHRGDSLLQFERLRSPFETSIPSVSWSRTASIPWDVRRGVGSERGT